MIFYGAGKGSLLVPEELRFDQALGVLREVDFDEIAGEAFAESFAAGVKGDES